jgi:hypothetical protein
LKAEVQSSTKVKKVNKLGVEHKHLAGNAYKFDIEKRTQLLEFMREGKSVETAAKAVGVTRVTVFLVRKADPEFAKAFDAAKDIGADVVDDELWAGAVEGKRINFHAVIAILNSRRPQLYRQNYKIEHGGTVGVLTADALKVAFTRLAADEQHPQPSTEPVQH